jgi:tRNA (cytidine/uridine-2'-O-)-methyltransferase
MPHNYPRIMQLAAMRRLRPPATPRQPRRGFGHAHGANSRRALGPGAAPAAALTPDCTASAAPPLLHVVLVNPDIPNNTGAAGRTCLGFGAALHVVEPLGFDLSDSRVKRAGLDYWEHVDLRVHASWAALVEHLTSPPISMQPSDFFFVTKFADASLCDTDFVAAATVTAAQPPPLALVFGSETKGLRAIEADAAYAGGQTVGLPMLNTDVLRSLNLGTCVAIVLWEAYRQLAAAASVA